MLRNRVIKLIRDKRLLHDSVIFFTHDMRADALAAAAHRAQAALPPTHDNG
jgi:hypothetical protein